MPNMRKKYFTINTKSIQKIITERMIYDNMINNIDKHLSHKLLLLNKLKIL